MPAPESAAAFCVAVFICLVLKHVLVLKHAPAAVAILLSTSLVLKHVLVLKHAPAAVALVSQSVFHMHSFKKPFTKKHTDA